MSQMRYEFDSFVNLVRRKRQAELIAAGKTFPFFRSFRYSFTSQRDELLDRLALQSGLAATRMNENEMLMDDGETIVHVNMYSRRRYVDCNWMIWTHSVAAINEINNRLLLACGDSPRHTTSIRIAWHFNTALGMTHVDLEEPVDDEILDEAYPSISGGTLNLVTRFLASAESVLILQGPPGTGKTRLIRQILGAMSVRRGEAVRVLYTGDQRLMESDELFVKFVTGSHDAFVFEDGDHFLQPRSDGNRNLHRLLTVSDGLIQAKGRKLIFSTNLPNIGDLDDALLRPGRCYAHFKLPELTMDQAQRFLDRVEVNDAVVRRTVQIAKTINVQSVSLASLYKHLAAARLELELEQREGD
jgi:hypothetical protein